MQEMRVESDGIDDRFVAWWGANKLIKASGFEQDYLSVTNLSTDKKALIFRRVPPLYLVG